MPNILLTLAICLFIIAIGTVLATTLTAISSFQVKLFSEDLETLLVQLVILIRQFNSFVIHDAKIPLLEHNITMVLGISHRRKNTQ